MKEIKWAIIGAGNIAKQFVTELNKQPQSSVVAIASRHIDSAKSFAQQFNINTVYETDSALVEQCDADIVYIASPHQLHFSQALACLNAGKAVLCEKPMTLNAQQSTQLIQLAQQKQLFLMEAMITPLLPAIQAVQTLIAKGDLGKIKRIQAGMGFQAEADLSSRVFNPDLAGGALLDVGIYPLVLAQLLLKTSPCSVSSEVEKAVTGVDQQSIVNLKYTVENDDKQRSEYETSTLVQCQSSVVSFLPCHAVIYGTKLIAELPDFSWSGQKIILKNHQGGVVEEINYAPNENAYFIEAAHVNQCLQQGLIESPLVSHQQTVAVLEIMDTLRAQWSLKYPNE
ncbi:Gfo/Idh/MocA family protein [Psychromonas sp. Urea-02u-13]|uniref:Gfo/Idh/MocA family protein n=1 Tax=Psychromonas sp. Urea-02u-13 TaxID=2058326 RepID=UPI0012FED36B|nr:Gfo/Idh/MocA family oxidoreductase [Psychromonas sp. Urea-02u-13]